MASSVLAKWWKLNYHMVAWLCLLAGSFALLAGCLGVAYASGDAPVAAEFISNIGAWGYWLILFGTLGVLMGGYYTFDRLSRMKKFDDLMGNRSRARFIRDLDDIERLAYGLGPTYEFQVMERKREYKLK